MSAKAVCQSSPFFAYVDFLTYAIDYIYGDTCIGVSDFRGLGPGIVPVLEIN